MKLDFAPAESFRGTRILRQANNLAYAYEINHTAVDADGAPNAYHPDDIGLDALANAGYPHTNWWQDVLVPDPNHPTRAYVQPSGEYEGYFVAMTSLRAPNGARSDPSTYVDATRFPYVVIPTGFEKLAHVAKAGDVGFATHIPTGVTSTFIVGDSGGGSAARLGEGSIALFVALGGQTPNPRTGAGVPKGKVQYIIFPNSRKAGDALWPRTNRDIHDQAVDLISNTPGIAAE
jgi:Fungal chitosanase of glycosyl hydrolase group 75